MIAEGSRIIGLTSEGNYLAMEGYGPVSVAKVAMEAIIRQIGWELGQYGITANMTILHVFLFRYRGINFKINALPTVRTNCFLFNNHII